MSYVGAAANIVGGELQGWASVLDKQAAYDAFLKQQQAQQGFRQEGAKMFGDFATGMGSDQAAKDLATGAANRVAAYGTADAIPMQVGSIPYMKSTSDARDQAFATSRGLTRANLGAYSDWSLNQTLRNIQNTERLRNLVSRAGGSAAVYPYQAYQAQHSMDDLAMIGAAISSIGGGAANYAQYAQGPSPTATSGAMGNPVYNSYINGAAGTDPYLGAALSLG